MANPEHLKILKQGVDAWNRWREENPEVKPDLGPSFNDMHGANLNSNALSGIDFSNANLEATILTSTHFGQRLHIVEGSTVVTPANLSCSNLFTAVMNETQFPLANLRGARLSSAYCRFTDFSSADLSRAVLKGAWLLGVNFFSSHLSGTIFDGAILDETRFVAVDLTDAIGLDKCVHRSPSTIDHRTLLQSRGLPTEFLRGCGLPDDIIDWYKNLHVRTNDFYSCFISYSSRDQDFADRLYADMQDSGVRCWLATENLKIGDEIGPTIDRAIRLRDKLVVILSEESIKSPWVKDEVQAAFEEERKRNKLVLFPIRIDNAIMETDEPWASKLRQRHIGDFTNWSDLDSYKKAFERLIRDLRAGTKDKEPAKGLEPPTG